ncbi:uncharacterized protein LOC143259379 [Megalopta genalis]|uniref:uncharacterized protein LOC143259379 n=1 Tax=Megalopta genalis TaxID=115081 RepID=UPI003FD5489E
MKTFRERCKRRVQKNQHLRFPSTQLRLSLTTAVCIDISLSTNPSTLIKKSDVFRCCSLCPAFSSRVYTTDND